MDTFFYSNGYGNISMVQEGSRKVPFCFKIT